MSEKTKILNIKRDLNNSSNEYDDKFWFDEITEASFYDEDILDKSKPSIKLVQDPNYNFLKTDEDTLDIEKTDIYNKGKYSSIDVIPYSEEENSKLPQKIIDLRRKSQIINDNEMDKLLEKINQEKLLKNYDLSDSYDFSNNTRKGSNSKFSIKDDDISSIVKGIKKQILSELKNEFYSKKNFNGPDTTNVTKEFLNRQNRKLLENNNKLKEKKSLLEMTRYSFEKVPNKFKFSKSVEEPIDTFKNAPLSDKESVTEFFETKVDDSTTDVRYSFDETITE